MYNKLEQNAQQLPDLLPEPILYEQVPTIQYFNQDIEKEQEEIGDALN